MVLAEFIEFKNGLCKSCGIECFEGIMLEPCLLQPCFHVAGGRGRPARPPPGVLGAALPEALRGRAAEQEHRRALAGGGRDGEAARGGLRGHLGLRRVRRLRVRGAGVQGHPEGRHGGGREDPAPRDPREGDAGHVHCPKPRRVPAA